MLLATWVEIPFRTTRDLDLLGRGPSDVTSIAETFRAICSQAVPDDGVESMRADWKRYRSARSRNMAVRVRTTAVIDRARIAVRLASLHKRDVLLEHH